MLDDELDELDFGHNTRTRFWDVSDLDAPSVDHFFVNSTTPAIDHNLYTRGDCAFEANYRAGLSILRGPSDSTLMCRARKGMELYPREIMPFSALRVASDTRLQKLQKFYESLPPQQRKRLENLPRDQFQLELRRMFFQHNRPDEQRKASTR